MPVQSELHAPNATQEYGSEFFLPPADWLEETEPPPPSHPPAWAAMDHRLLSSGRGAISLILDSIEDTRKIALLPAYTCGSVCLPFQTHGYHIYFYDIHQDFSPDTADFMRMLEVCPSVFVHMGYFGIASTRLPPPLLAAAKQTDAVIIEDITHTVFCRDVDHTGSHYLAASLRKWMGMPSGGAAVAMDGNPLAPAPLVPHHAFYEPRHAAMRLKSCYLLGSARLGDVPSPQSRNPGYLQMFTQADAVVWQDPAPYAIDPLSARLWAHVDSEAIIMARRRNFARLLSHLHPTPAAELFFCNLQPQDSPLFFPLHINNDRRKLQRLLAEHRVYCPAHWSTPALAFLEAEELDAGFSGAKDIEDHILSLPCDQRYTPEDMDQIIAILQTCLREVER